MAAAATDVFDVVLAARDAQAALHRHHAGRRRRGFAQELRHERLHAGDRE